MVLERPAARDALHGDAPVEIGRAARCDPRSGSGPDGWPASPAPRVRCRLIAESDLPSVERLLRKGFPTRGPRYWRDGFERQGRRILPADWPRFGVMLDHEGEAVGVILMLFSPVDGAEGSPRCNLSSWYVDPGFRAHTGRLVMSALRRRDVTYTNISPAHHTGGMLAAIGFKPFTSGRMLSVPALVGCSAGTVRIKTLGAGGRDGVELGPGERRVLEDHAAMGCISLVAETDAECHPFVFLPYRLPMLGLATPAAQLVYCRSPESFARLAGPLGRHLARRGILVVALDAQAPVTGLPGIYRQRCRSKLYRGSEAPRPGDLAYSERVVFGA